MLRVVVWDFKGRGRQFTGRGKSKCEVDKCLVAQQRQEDPELPSRLCSLQIITDDSCAPVGDLRSKFFRQLRGKSEVLLESLGSWSFAAGNHLHYNFEVANFLPPQNSCLDTTEGVKQEEWDRTCVSKHRRMFGRFPGCPPSSAEGVGSTPAWGAKVPQASWPKSQTMEQKQYCDKFSKDLKKKTGP